MVGREKEAAELAMPAYWDERYSQSDGVQPTHEWFKSYDQLQPFLKNHLFNVRIPQDQPTILHLGAGDSDVPQHLLERGYRDQLCVDFSPAVVGLMKAKQLDGITWRQADVRDMPSITSGSVDVAFDKGTLDAMIHGSPWDPPDEVKQNASRYMREVARVLKHDGVFLYITFRQPHFVKPLLNQDELWDLTFEVLREGESSFDYYAFSMRKATKASPS
ncbi:hypothetical protein LTR35_009176 [Friedmanniomyces endolithicus]|uniref:Methyltransferase type 11 domain-containing protein n=1 Tax=Friedmanniomyces endolithicus TaxID=329885 RepID=A0AAN6FL32_9PEZI|nr:hypothetical protein LTR35_009176 [Friedmanniomyces endolithicus]KAK0292235.1 hypothetical protein LTS00_008070 [Friedmanniomyces endolithicus]KAK0320229.1 hypothetical protein LTR82_008746 [Friedmanniomyces endolithicus]KAK0986332.1 hypothetical protein LTR54_013503 [Friedmanniomyces endolithicus]